MHDMTCVFLIQIPFKCDFEELFQNFAAYSMMSVACHGSAFDEGSFLETPVRVHNYIVLLIYYVVKKLLPTDIGLPAKPFTCNCLYTLL